jgi:phosphohistidine phosphatase
LEAGRWLAANVGTVDLAVVSPAERARSTWELASAELGAPPPTRVEERAYAASGDTLLDLVHGLPEELDTVVLVGHNPGLEDLVSLLAGRWVLMKTSGIAVLALPGHWSSGDDVPAEVEAFGRPPTTGSAH